MGLVARVKVSCTELSPGPRAIRPGWQRKVATEAEQFPLLSAAWRVNGGQRLAVERFQIASK